jgi:DNA-binding transcriptional MerR regulator
MTTGHMHIGEAADRAGLSIRTLRHYDEAGLVVPSARTDGGFRLYTEPDLDRLRVIKRMKPLGFTLEEMRDLLDVLDGLDAAHDGDRTGCRTGSRCSTPPPRRGCGHYVSNSPPPKASPGRSRTTSITTPASRLTRDAGDAAAPASRRLPVARHNRTAT